MIGQQLNSRELAFLTYDLFPSNLRGAKPGDKLEVVTPRIVHRVGYRSIPKDFIGAARDLVRTEELWPAWTALCNATGRTNGQFERRMVDALAYGLAVRERFGGPERGIMVEDRPELANCSVEVRSTRIVQVGTRYPPSGGADWDDWENGGLANRRPIVLVTGTDGREYISGDLR